MNRQEKWDKRFLRLSEEISTWSKDPSTKVGAVIVRDINKIVSVGYNGFDEDDPDLPEHYADRSIKYPKIIHAERNAINNHPSNRKRKILLEKLGIDVTFYDSCKGCTIYTTPFPPCNSKHRGAGCTDLIIESGIVRVVSYKPTEAQYERWGESFESSSKKFDDAGVEFVLYEGET